jgi:hypothetical protein
MNRTFIGSNIFAMRGRNEEEDQLEKHPFVIELLGTHRQRVFLTFLYDILFILMFVC